MPSARLPVFEKFIGDLRTVWSAETDDARRMDKATPLVETFVKDPDLKAHSAQWPSTEGRKNLLLYVDPAYDFVVNAVVRVPGRTGSVHDHANAWCSTACSTAPKAWSATTASTTAAGPAMPRCGSPR